MKRFASLTAAVVSLVALAAHAEVTPDDVIKEFGLKEDAQPVRNLPGWKKPKTVVVVVDEPGRLEWMQAVAPGVKLIPAANNEAAIALVKDADAVIGICVPPLADAAKKARWIHTAVAGVEGCIKSERVAKGEILLTNMQRVAGSIMAEHVIAMMFGLTRGIGEFVKSQEREDFNQRLVPMSKLWEVNGRTMLIAGLGGIGTEVARRAHALGMKVIATRNSGTEGPDFVSYVGKSDELAKLAAEADVIVDSLPSTPETRNLFNAAMFARMRPDALFINVGRGDTVVQEDLMAALNAKKLGGAAIDVMLPEPLPKGHPLWKTRNLIITPHVSGWAAERNDRIWIVNREELRRYVAGEKMLSVVDPKKGY